MISFAPSPFWEAKERETERNKILPLQKHRRVSQNLLVHMILRMTDRWVCVLLELGPKPTVLRRAGAQFRPFREIGKYANFSRKGSRDGP